MFQSEVEGRIVDWSLLIKDVNREFSHDLDYLISMLDWDANVNPHSQSQTRRSRAPVKAHGGDGRPGLPRTVDHLWNASLFRQGAHGITRAERDDQGPGSLRSDSDPGIWRMAKQSIAPHR